MGAIPTSLIVVLLVAAWLVVLVPMYARSREAVPETDDGTAGFRVLRRASRRIRRRPTLETGTAETDAAADAEYDDADFERADLEDAELEGSENTEFDAADDADVAEFEGDRRAERVTVRTRAAYETPAYEPAYDEAGYDETRYDETANDSNYDELTNRDESRMRPIPRRSGRGGFDPEAAERAKAYRYAQRRRVAGILLLSTIGFSLAAYLAMPALWIGATVTGLMLIGYLTYLRRQVRIEEQIRSRRLARLQRARQIRPEYHRARYEDEPVSPYVRPEQFADETERPRPAVSRVPAAAYRPGRVIVDLDDDDPAFDDLEHYEPMVYRRAAGQ